MAPIPRHWVLVNLEPDGIPMVTVWKTELEARQMIEKQCVGGGPYTITLLCEVHWAMHYDEATPAMSALQRT